MEDTRLDSQPLEIASHGDADVPVYSVRFTEVGVEDDKEEEKSPDAYVLPRAGGPTMTMAIRPEWKSRPDMVL